MTNLSPEALQKINRNLVKALGMVVISYGFDFVLLAGLAYSGSTSIPVVLAYGVAGLLQNLFFYLLVKTGVNKKFKDPSMAVWQIVCGTLVQVFGMVLAPEIGIFFLVNLFNCFLFGVLALNTRQYFQVWLFGVATTGMAFFYVGDRIGFPNSSGLTQAIMWIAFLLALGKSIFLANTINVLRRKVSEKNSALRTALKQMEEMATHDALTGLLNRRAMLGAMEAELQLFKRKHAPFCIAVMDLDHFKHINDSYGHAAGDQVLKIFAGILQESLRVTDRVSRYGGDEFVVLLTDTPQTDARIVLERICGRIAQYDWRSVVPDIPVTISVGFAEIEANETVAQVFERADRALYEAKQSGRNNVHAALDCSTA